MKPVSPQYRTVCIVSYAVLALVLLIAGLIWRAEVKGQALRQQRAAEQAQAEQVAAQQRAAVARYQAERAHAERERLNGSDPWHDAFGKFTGKITEAEFRKWFFDSGRAGEMARLGFSVNDVMEWYQEMGFVFYH